MSSLLPASPPLIRFGLYEVDLVARELRRGGAVVRLQDRPFEVLAILIERPGDVISREEFRRRLWSADVYVDFDASLNTSITKLRQALGDNADNPRFIATAGRRGYRFIAPASVALLEPPLQMPDADLPAAPTRGRLRSPGDAILAIAAILSVAIAAVAVLLPPSLPKVVNVTQISRDGLLDPWGRLTTDGARVFYLDRSGGHWTLMQVPASGGDSQPFSQPSQNTRFVDISPDRAQLLTFTFLGRSTDLPLSLTPVVGGPSRRVGDILADDAVFSLDGKRIYYNRSDGIYSCAQDGSHVEKLVELPGRSEDPRWSKDGRRLRFTLLGRGDGASSIWEVSADGKNLHEVNLNLAQPGPACCGRWSADGRYFFFTAIRDGLQSIWVTREGSSTWLTGPARPVQLTFGPNNYGGLVSDVTANRVFVWSGNEHLEMVRYYADSGRVQPLLPGVSAANASLSPDGTAALYSTGGELWRIKADGSDRRSLASGFSSIDTIQWSPDAKRILFHVPGSGNTGKHFVVAADGGTAAEIKLGNGHLEPAWAEGSNSLVFARWASEGETSPQQSGIFLFNLATSQTVKIPGSEGLVHPSYSPDGRYIAAITNFDLNPTQPTRVELFDARTQQWTEIAHGTLLNPVQWSPDSKTLYYQDILGEGQPSFRYSTADNKSVPFVDFAHLIETGYVRSSFLRFAPDGSLVMALRRNEVNVYRLDLELP